MLKKNDIIELKIENCDLEGKGIGRYEGMAVFVPSAAKGDVIKAHILKVKSNCAFAKIEEIITPSEDREEAICPVYLKCGGCAFGHIKYEVEASLKENHVKECFRRIGGLEPKFEPIIAEGEIYGYRNKGQFPVEIDGGEIKTGFYANHSHRVIHCPGCKLQPKEFEIILNAFEKYIKSENITSYDETEHKGLLRHIYMRKGTFSGEIMVCPVINGKSLPNEEKLVAMLTSACNEITSIIVNVNREKTNVILGRECRTIYGKDYITDKLCGLEFRLSPLSFYQVNRDRAELLYRKAKEYASLTGNETLLDLYCGTGTIGLSMAHDVKQLIGVEIVEQAIKDARINAENNGITNARFECNDASDAAKMLKNEDIRPDVIVLDPPRKGCAPDLLKTVTEMNPDRIVYVSCDPATLARDCKILGEMGYETQKVTPVDMFPRTGHVESVVLLVKLPPDDVVNIELDLTKLPVSIHDGDATYDEIKKYVLSHHGLKVSSLYISQVKRKFGLKVTEAYNKPKSENSHQPQCPPEKEKAITEALKYFKMI